MTGISKERMQKALQQEKTISREDHAKIKAIAGTVKMPRSFLFKNPDDYGMANWESLSIPSDDGTPLEAWYIPAKGGESDKLVIFNHALPMCRAGYPGHLGPPWSNFVEAVEIDFVIQYKHLTDAGYNVLTYDFRNHGQSGAANNGVCGVGQWEWRDCVGVKRFVTPTHVWAGWTSHCSASAWVASRSTRPSPGIPSCSRTSSVSSARWCRT